MTFLNQSFLWFAALAAVPVIIHLLNRTRLRKIKFSTLRFLQPATKKVLKRFKLLELLLLLLRMAIILFLTLAFARPVWKGYVGKHEVLYNVILIDNSYSMEYRIGKGNALKLSRELARQLIRELAGQFAVGVINNGLEKLHPFTDEKKVLMERISSIKRSPFTTDILKAVQETIAVLKTENIKKNIIILSDFNIDGFKDPDPAPRSRVKLNGTHGIRFLLIDTCPGAKNLWIDKVTADSSYTGIPTKIKTLLNAKDAAEVKVSLIIEGQKRNHKLIEISKSKEVDFNYTFKKQGLHPGRIEIESSSECDRIDIDNIYYFHAHTRPKIKVLIVDGNPGYTLMGGESFFVARALTPGNYETPLTLRIVNPHELKSIGIDTYEVMLLLNVKLEEDIIKIISDFSAKGSGAGIFLGDNVEYNIYNRLLSSLMPVEITKIKPVEINKEVKLKVSEKFKNVFAASSEVKLGAVFQTRSDTMKKSDISINDELPLLWLYSPGKLIRGRVALFTATADMDWSNFPLKSSYPAFIHKLVLYLASTVKSDSDYLNAGQVIPEVGAKLPGNYVINSKIYSVNLNSKDGESDLNQLSFYKIKKLFDEQDIYYIPYSSNLHNEIIKRISGKEKSEIFLIGAFVFLILEEFLRKFLKSRQS